MPLDFLHGNDSQGRGEATCQFSATFTVRNQIFSGVDFGRFMLNFRNFSIFLDRIQTGTRSKSSGIVCSKD